MALLWQGWVVARFVCGAQQVLGASCSCCWTGLSPTAGRGTAASSLSSRGFCSVCVPHMDTEQAVLSSLFVPMGQAGRKERCKGNARTLPTHPSRCAVGGSAGTASPAAAPGFAFPHSSLLLSQNENQSLTGAFTAVLMGAGPRTLCRESSFQHLVENGGCSALFRRDSGKRGLFGRAGAVGLPTLSSIFRKLGEVGAVFTARSF